MLSDSTCLLNWFDLELVKTATRSMTQFGKSINDRNCRLTTFVCPNFHSDPQIASGNDWKPPDDSHLVASVFFTIMFRSRLNNISFFFSFSVCASVCMCFLWLHIETNKRLQNNEPEIVFVVVYWNVCLVQRAHGAHVKHTKKPWNRIEKKQMQKSG